MAAKEIAWAVSRAKGVVMTRIRRTLITVLAAFAVGVAIGSPAMAADYSSVSALVADQGSAAAEPSVYSSPNAIGGGAEAEVGPGAYSAVNAIVGNRAPGESASPSNGSSNGPSSVSSILGPDEVTSTIAASSQSADSADGFDWGDALIGAGITLGLALTTALLLGMMQRKSRLEPTV